MKTDINQHYETLKLAHTVVENYEGGKTNTYAAAAYPFAKALLDLEERRQLALGYLGEAIMYQAPDAHIGRARDILSLEVEV